jgi:CubicO group peptidase (beta-lactamase class C family)
VGGLAALLTHGCAPEHGAVTLAPPATADGWAVSTPAAEGLDAATLAGAFRAVEEDRALATVRALLVVRHGRLVAEGYFRGAGRDTRHDVRSVTKSVTSLAVGTALARGELRGVTETVGGRLGDLLAADRDPRKRAITLEDLLTMRAGLRWSEHGSHDRHPATMYRARSSAGWVLAFPMVTAPGRTFNYSTGNTQLVSAMVARATGRPLAQVAAARLLEPLGVRDAAWGRHADGLSYGGTRLFLRARDMAKLGELCLRDGGWGGRQLVPATWIRASTRPRVALAVGGYGYGWWIRPHGYAAQGWGGQYVYVLPGEDAVVVMTADPNRGVHLDFPVVERLIERHVRAAVRDRAR